MSITLKTGAFGPVIPVELASRQEHNLFHDEDEVYLVVPEASNIQTDQDPPNDATAIDGFSLLDLMWNVKTFDITTKWAFTDIGFLDNVTFSNGTSGQSTRQKVNILNAEAYTGASGASGASEPVASFPWTNSPLIAAMKWTEYRTTPYPVNRAAARQLVRDEFRSLTYFGGYGDYYYFQIHPKKNYDEQKEQLSNAYASAWQEFTSNVTELLSFFQNDTSIRGTKIKEECERILEEQPSIKEYYDTLLAQQIAYFDGQEQNPNTTPAQVRVLISQLAQLEVAFVFSIKAELNLEMFDLAGGFKNQLEFLPWNRTKSWAEYGYPHRGFGGFPAAVNGRTAATGATGETEHRRKYKHDVSAYVQPYVDGAFTSTITEQTTVRIWDSSAPPPEGSTEPGAETTQEIDLVSTITFLPFGQPGQAGSSYGTSLSLSRSNNTLLEFATASQIQGGSVDGMGVSFNYGSFYDQDGNQLDASQFPELIDFTPQVVGVPLPSGVSSWNDIIYSGVLEYGGYQSILDFFEPIAAKVRQIKEQGPLTGEIGKFRFLNENNELMVEVPLYGSTLIWSNITIEYKINEFWDLSGASGASGASGP